MAVSEIPPVPDPNVPPPQTFAEYPRGPQAPMYGTAEKLKALSDGYFGMNWVFLVNVAVLLGSRVLLIAADRGEVALMLLAGSVIVTGLVVALFSYSYNKKISFGMNWQPSMAIVMSIVLALQSWLCCGAIGIVVIQQIVTAEIKRYGIPGGLFGFKKKVVEERIAQMRSTQPPTPFIH